MHSAEEDSVPQLLADRSSYICHSHASGSLQPAAEPEGAIMPYDMPRIPLTSANDVRRTPLVVHHPQPAARAAANAAAANQAEAARPIEPMLLVYQERAETFRLIAEAITRAVKALARSFAA